MSVTDISVCVCVWSSWKSVTDITLVTSHSRMFKLKFKLTVVSDTHYNSQKLFQNVPEYYRMFQNVPEGYRRFQMSLHSDCRSMSLNAGPWACMQIHELVCRSMSLYAGPWACMQLHKLACSYISLHAVTLACMVLVLHKLAGPWACMQLPELTWSSMRLHDVSWACMQFLFLSEQLTHKNFAMLVDTYTGWSPGLSPPLTTLFSHMIFFVCGYIFIKCGFIISWKWGWIQRSSLREV